jgi:large subunit ribosomal protein L19
MDALHLATASFLKSEIAEFRAGDKVAVHVKIIEGDKERIQLFEGDVVQIKGTGINKSFTVRKMSNGIGVERIFPLHSPRIDKVVKIRSGSVRRARIYYIRDLSGKAARIKEKSSK